MVREGYKTMKSCILTCYCIGFIVTFMTFAITQARPAAKLGPSRPSAKPVGLGTLLSILGVVFINFWFIVCR